MSVETQPSITELLNTCQSLVDAGNLSLALQKIYPVIDLARQQGDVFQIAEAILRLAGILCRLGHYPSAIERAYEVLAMLPETPFEASARMRVFALTTLGNSACETDNLNAGEEYYRQAIDLARLINFERGIAANLHNLSGMVYAPRGQFALSITADLESLRLYRRAGHPEDCWTPLVMLSYVYRLTHQPEKSLEMVNELNSIAIPGSLADGYAVVFRGWLDLEAGDLKKSGDCFARGRVIAENIGAPELYFELYLGLCRQSVAAKELAAALAWAEEAITIVNRTGYVHYQGRGWIEHGRCQQQLGRLAAAEQDFRKAIELLTPLRLNFDRTRALFYLANLQQQQKSPDAAVTCQEAILEITNHNFLFLLEQERGLTYSWVTSNLDNKELSAQNTARTVLDILQKVAPHPLQINLLGGLKVKIGAQILSAAQFRQRRSGELLGLLLLAPNHSMAFEEVAEALCPEQMFDSAKTVVHHATSTLRHLLEPDLPNKRFPSRYLEVEDGIIHLHLPPGSWLDINLFQVHHLAKEWKKAIDLYQGDFLPEYRYLDWAVGPRETLAEQFRQALLFQAEASLANQDWHSALSYARRCISLEPWQERATEVVMRASAALNDTSSMLRYYRKLCKNLKNDLNIEPSQELQLLYRSLLKSRNSLK
jgi:DNA-binding SARP family transcriptional activator